MGHCIFVTMSVLPLQHKDAFNGCFYLSTWIFLLTFKWRTLKFQKKFKILLRCSRLSFFYNSICSASLCKLRILFLYKMYQGTKCASCSVWNFFSDYLFIFSFVFRGERLNVKMNCHNQDWLPKNNFNITSARFLKKISISSHAESFSQSSRSAFYDMLILICPFQARCVCMFSVAVSKLLIFDFRIFSSCFQVWSLVALNAYQFSCLTRSAKI